MCGLALSLSSFAFEILVTVGEVRRLELRMWRLVEEDLIYWAESYSGNKARNDFRVSNLLEGMMWRVTGMNLCFPKDAFL